MIIPALFFWKKFFCICIKISNFIFLFVLKFQISYMSKFLQKGRHFVLFLILNKVKSESYSVVFDSLRPHGL